MARFSLRLSFISIFSFNTQGRTGLSVYSKQPILGLTQEFCWVSAYVGGNIDFYTLGSCER